jgi:hypothetical protein
MTGPEEGEEVGGGPSSRLPNEEPVLRALGALRHLTFKSGEKSPEEKNGQKKFGQDGQE